MSRSHYYNKNKSQKENEMNNRHRNNNFKERQHKFDNTINKFNLEDSSNESPYKDLIERFPKCELSYGQMDHTKVQYDLYAAIPAGKKMMAWFTYYKSQHCCFLIHSDKSCSVHKIEKSVASFHPDLCLGTIFYGTLIHYDKSPFFCIEDICYYKDKALGPNQNRGFTNQKKYDLLCYILEHEINKKTLLPSHLTFMLPHMATSRNELYDYLPNLPYKIYCIQHILLKTRKLMNEVIYNKEPPIVKAVFRVKANVQNDIYELYCYNNNTSDHYYNIAYIPDYKTSVFMNNIFRYIAENNNLDSLEESDDEEDFENIDEAKYVDLEKVVNMECSYHPKFRKWVPIKVVNTYKISNLKIIGELIRNQRK